MMRCLLRYVTAYANKHVRAFSARTTVYRHKFMHAYVCIVCACNLDICNLRYRQDVFLPMHTYRQRFDTQMYSFSLRRNTSIRNVFCTSDIEHANSWYLMAQG